MSPIDWALTPLKKYADFSGRAPRAEFWWFFLFAFIASVVVQIVDSLLHPVASLYGYGILSTLLSIALFIPYLAVQVRRLHDTDRTGWLVLAPIVPYVVGVWLMWPIFAAAMNLDPNNPEAAAAVVSQGTASGSLAMGGLFMFASLILAVVLLVFDCLAGTKGENRFGPDPYGA